MTELIVGIDLGTTNSEIAVVRDGHPSVLDVDQGPILPSVVGMSEDGRLLVGRAARNQYVVAPERTVKSIKRKMGEPGTVRLGSEEYTPQEISAMILRTLKVRAEAQLQQTISKAVITVPAFFNDTQRQATIEAGRIAGLDVVRILNEPTAASLCYGCPKVGLQRTLVYDLGGGTFDVSIVQAQDGVIEVLASHGDTHLGGDDFDAALLDFVAAKFQEQHGVDLRATPVSKARLLRAVEEAKKQLSDHPYARLEEEFIAHKDGVSLHLDLEISRDLFERLIHDQIERTMDHVERALADAALTPRQLDRVVLVGGSTRIPLVQQMLRQRLGQDVHGEISPDLVVAMGASLQAARIAGENVGSVLVDVTPHSLGIRCVDFSYDGLDAMEGRFDYRFAPIIRRNTPLPASRSELFETLVDNQPIVQIDIYQGESSDVRFNHRVGKLTVEGLSPMPAGNPIIVQFDLDLNGVLRVTAREKVSGRHRQITIQNALNRPLDAWREASQRLDHLFLPTTSDEDNDSLGVATLDRETEAEEWPQLVPAPAEGQRETVQARALLEKAERLRQQASEEDRADLDRSMREVRVALTDRKWAELKKACDDLADLLFYLEDF